MLRLFFALLIAGAAAREWAVRLQEGVNPRVFAGQHGLSYKGPIGSFGEKMRYFRFHEKEGASFDGGDEALGVEWSELQKPQLRYTRTNDPLFRQQWNLSEMHVEKSWESASGEGVVVGVVDDGLQWSHPELARRFARELSVDVNDRDADPSPSAWDSHGTAAAALVAGERDNNVCGSGVAPGARLAGIRLLGGPSSDADEAEALSHEPQKIAVYSCSWGPVDDGMDLRGPGPLALEAIRHGVESGRGGKGSIYVWAAGNGGQNGDNVGYDGFASSPFTIAVGALDNTGKRAFYSEQGASLHVMAPSSGYRQGIISADLDGRCTTSFGGTSAAAPQVAGVVALMLQRRPELTWRDVQHVLAKSALEAGSEWVNKRGYRHSHAVGFGLTDAALASSLAATWQLVPAQKEVDVPEARGSWRFSPGSPARVQIQVKSPGVSFTEHVIVRVYFRHPRRGETELRLTSPEGHTSVLSALHADPHPDAPSGGWPYVSVRHWGEDPSGTWTLEASSSQWEGRIEWAKMYVWGY